MCVLLPMLRTKSVDLEPNSFCYSPNVHVYIITAIKSWCVISCMPKICFCAICRQLISFPVDLMGKV